MTEQDPTTEPRPERRGIARRIVSLRGAIAAAVVLSTVPAAAAVLIQNFVKADVTTVPPCVTKIAGVDSTTYSDAAKAPYFAINTTNTATTTDGVKLLNETLTLKAFQGDRLYVTDAMRIKNSCDYPLTVSLKAEAQFGNAATSGTWTDLDVRAYLGRKTGGASGTDFSLATDWDAAPIHVSPGATGTLANASTGSIVVPAGEDRQVGLLIDAGTTSAAAPATLRFTVTAAG